MLLHQPLLNTQLIFVHVYFVDPLSYPLGRGLDSPSDDDTTLLGVGEILGTGDLEFPVLLDKSEGEDTVVVERGPEDGMEHECDLLRGYVL